jgi:hypothetical protein
VMDGLHEQPVEAAEAASPKPVKRAAKSPVRRKKDAASPPEGGNVPRPSRKGFKWPEA